MDSNKTINIKESERTIAEKTTKTQTAKDSKTINQSDRKVEEQKECFKATKPTIKYDSFKIIIW